MDQHILQKFGFNRLKDYEEVFFKVKTGSKKNDWRKCRFFFAYSTQFTNALLNITNKDQGDRIWSGYHDGYVSEVVP